MAPISIGTTCSDYIYRKSIARITTIRCLGLKSCSRINHSPVGRVSESSTVCKDSRILSSYKKGTRINKEDGVLSISK